MSDTLIKWPGGKAREIKYIEPLLPEYERYIEPFFGGGAMFFHLRPRHAELNDISSNLMDFYALIKEGSQEFRQYLESYCQLFEDLLAACDRHASEILDVYLQIKSGKKQGHRWPRLSTAVNTLIDELDPCAVQSLVLDVQAYRERLYSGALDKMKRTIQNDKKAPYSADDLRENLITGFTSGNYLYFRDVYNDIALGRNAAMGQEYRAANFYFVREYCFGSMFRYNGDGEFNIPYGGMSYNRKDFRGKVEHIFSAEMTELFAGTRLSCGDFEDFLSALELKRTDFLFLDPPYDTDFSDYEGRKFTQADHERLAQVLKKIKAKFILVIKNTDFISALYEKDFHILCFDKVYTYNVRSRNSRKAKHLIVTNIPV